MPFQSPGAVSMRVKYANQGLRATVAALTDTYRSILERGGSEDIEGKLASLSEVFRLQDMSAWTSVEAAG